MKLFKKSTLNLAVFFFFFISSCASLGPTKPNTPYSSGEHPPVLNKLYQKNYLLVQELGKLPELQDGISADEMDCLRQLSEIYFSDPNAFNIFFSEIYQVGIPGVRRYCSPLQAFYWLIEDGKIDTINSLIAEYSLDKLLYLSWDFNEEISIVDLDLTDEQVKEIVASIDKEAIWYAKLQKNPKDIVILCYNRNPNAIPLKYRRIIENDSYFKKAKIYFDRNIKRWRDYEEIIERLNSPELLNFYLKINIRYYHTIPCYHRDPRTVIKEKFGDCDDLAYFGKVVLSKAGYDVFGRIVGNLRTEVHIGLGARLDDGSYLLAVNFKGQGNAMSGPYKTLLELDRDLGYGPSYNGRGSFSFTWFGSCR